MPIYEYNCEKCCQLFEELIFDEENAQIKCPQCGNENVKKLLSSSQFISSGSLNSCMPKPSRGFS